MPQTHTYTQSWRNPLHQALAGLDLLETLIFSILAPRGRVTQPRHRGERTHEPFFGNRKQIPKGSGVNSLAFPPCFNLQQIDPSPEFNSSHSRAITCSALASVAPHGNKQLVFALLPLWSLFFYHSFPLPGIASSATPIKMECFSFCLKFYFLGNSD